MMTSRRMRRISEGRSKAVPSSTKISKHTEAPSLNQNYKGPGYRTNRFAEYNNKA